eukprot:TRINITY_DN41087_c0_g1_i1.p1 TRINITY_DN41087_c0_g1~~TRINITY_DN41087_c0_g1_i1.p1  ORF type:complete len:163 (-),score=40.67 TRINITY_DN41087_c0_g1_i1:310-771(-)
MAPVSASKEITDATAVPTSVAQDRDAVVQRVGAEILQRFEAACEDAMRSSGRCIEWDTFEIVDCRPIFEHGWEQLLVSRLAVRLDALGLESVSVQVVDHSWTADNGETHRGWLNITASWPADILKMEKLDSSNKEDDVPNADKNECPRKEVES